MSSRHQSLERALAAEVVATSPLSGGDISQVERVELSDGRTAIVKRSRKGSSLAGEAQGLEWLAQAEAIRIPRVLAVFGDTLVLEDLGSGRPGPEFDETLGRGLARLHRFGAPCFGWHADNLLAELHQDNGPRSSWAEFYGQARLLPRAEACCGAGLLSGGELRRLEALVRRLETLIGDDEPPARLHGDLWSGNVHVCPDGGPALIDPAVYGGNREVDLAMLHLFGSPSARTMAAYEEVWPLSRGHVERRGMYQLYPLLVHLELFGSGYRRAVLGVLAEYE